MALLPLVGWKSLKTHHCVTGSMRHIYEFHGYPINEDLLLGIGAGVGFVYWYMEGTSPFYGGRANTGRSGEEGLEKTVGRRTGVRVVMCSAYGEYKQDFTTWASDAYVVKCADLTELKTTIRKLLGLL